MQTRFAHVNIISKDRKNLAEFYTKVFDCKPRPPERDLSGEWLDRLTGLHQSGIKGSHLKLPGYDSTGPTLEIFEYNREFNNSNKHINHNGLAHITFANARQKEIEEFIFKLTG